MVPMELVVPTGSGEEGNVSSPPPKRISPAKRWCLCLNNYTNDDIGSMVPVFERICRFGILALEIGEICGTKHVQGYVEFKNKLRPFSLGLTPRITWKLCKGNRDSNVRYCSKGNGYDDDPDIVWSKGLKKPVKLIEEKDMYNWQKEIIELLETEPDDRSIYWYAGPGGCGKTCFCKWLCMKKGAIMLSGKGGDVRNGVVEYVKLTGDTPEIVLVNIPRSHYGYVSYEGLENIKDMCFYSGKYEGGMVVGNCPHLLVFGNALPDMDKCSKDRWKVTKLEGFVEQEKSDYEKWKEELAHEHVSSFS